MQRAGGGRRVFLAGVLAGALSLPSAATVARAQASADAAARTPQPAASVYGSDDRRPVRDTRQFPWSAIGLLKVQVGMEVYVGTAVMVGRYTALTCGHVVYSSETRGAGSIQFVPGINGRYEPFGEVKVARVIPCPQWAANESDGYDIAMVVLDSPVGDQTGYFQCSVQPDSFFAAAPLTTAGYPTDLGTIYPYTVSGRSYGMEGNVIIHDLDSEPGQSGSPIWYGGSDQSARLVGLLEGSYITSHTPLGGSQEGIAARIDAQTAGWIQQQVATYVNGADGVADASSGTAITPGADVSPSVCGMGALQAALGASLAWSAAFVSRRRKAC